MMTCPRCQEEIAHDAAICPHCEEVVDPSLRAPRQNRRTKATSSSKAKIHSSPAPLGSVVEEEPWTFLWRFWHSLSRPNQLTLAACFGIFFSAFLPWKETALEGDVLGWLTWGGAAAALAACAISLLALRQRATRASNDFHWKAQLAALSVSTVWSIAAIKWAYVPTIVATANGTLAPTSTPSAGIAVGLVSSLVGAVATVLSRRR